MTGNHDLRVEVQGDHIIITLKGRSSWSRMDNPPELRAKSDWTDDPDASVTVGAFRARAWIASQ
jgi:hypothetical protein